MRGVRRARKLPWKHTMAGVIFDPKLIIYQMIALQAFYYLVLGALLAVFHILFGTTVSMDHFFSARYINSGSAMGWVEIAATMLTALAGSLLLALIVEKSRKCLDFTASLYIFHFLGCCMFRGMPATWDWWIVHGVALVVMVVLGEYLCARRELQDIPLSTII